MAGEYCYSTNEENYDGHYASHDEAAMECANGMEEGRRFWTGRCVPPSTRAPRTLARCACTGPIGVTTSATTVARIAAGPRGRINSGVASN